MGRALLSRVAREERERTDGSVYLPAPLKAEKRAFWAFGDKIKTVPWKEFFKVEQNEMVVYRIIPHSSITNNNKRLWRAIYQMYAMYEGAGSRLERDGFKFRFREKDAFWFDVIFKQENGQRKVEFYVSTSEYQATKLKRKLENKMAATIQETSIEALQVPQENTIVQELRYLKHDIFSLNTNTQEQKTPIAAILNTIDEFQFDGDFARLSLCAEAENRQKWVKASAWAYEKMQKGRVPQRANIDGAKIFGAGRTVIAGIVNEINDLLVDTFQAFTNSFFKSDKQYTKDKVIKKSFVLEDEINARRLSGSSLEKVNQPVFRTHIRVAAHSQDKLTRETIAETLGLAFTEIAENNELQAFKVRIGSRRYEIVQELNTLRLTIRSRADANVNLISTDELAKLALQMPTAELQRRYDAELNVKRNIETDIPAALRKEGGLYLGESEVKDKKTAIYFPLTNPDELYRGYVFIGGQGAGKDTAIKNWIIDGCLNHGISAIIPEVIVEEGERGMADGIRDSLPPDKIIDIDLSDGEYVVPMDLTEVISKLGRDGASRFADEVLDFFGDMEGLKRSKKILRTAAKASGGSLYNIQRIIEEEEFRADTIERLQSEGNERLADALISWGTNDDLGSKADPILDRLGDFFDNDKLYEIFAQPPKPEVDFAGWMEQGKVIIIRIPVRKLGQVAARTLVHWITLKAYMTRALMTQKEQANGCFMVFNEPEQYASDGLTRLMGRIGTEGRKERFGSLYAFHHWNKLPQSLQENLQGGGVQQFLFMNDHIKTFELSKHRLEPTITVDEAGRLPAHHAIISVRAGGEMQNAFVCHMRPPLKPQYDNSFLTKRHARMFGRHWQELQQAL
ncbi:ATP-binding protein [Paenibacillus alkaliterrae]|nr:ATP-binding protein [Paenibacillus alkaliterrae]MCF2939057.1 ATP-binding protein [Paenibacillus alkaliterrae]